MKDSDIPGTETAETEIQFAELLRNLWRAVTRWTRVTGGLPTLPPSHAEALRRLLASGGLTPSQLAHEMSLSRSTISEVISKLEDADLIVRRPSRTDARSVVLTPTEHASYVHETFRRGRADCVAAAFAMLSADDASQLRADIPVLQRLLTHLETLAEQADGEASKRAATTGGADGATEHVA
jgi:DNA-binding MarR family transcriptional regulator